MTINKLDEFDNEEDFDVVTFNIDNIKSKIPTYKSEKLCEMIVADQYFECYKEMSACCMEELAKRREAGDVFNFEQFINDSMKELPVINLIIPDLGTVLRSLIGQVKK